jgi:riboflavin kinase / FMN adenylyltransferase
MRLIRHSGAVVGPADGSVAALGDFDGFHLGHRRVVARAVELARERGLKSAAVVLDPPFAVFSRRATAGGVLSTMRQQLRLLDAMGVGWVALQHRSRRSAAASDSTGLLLGALRARAVVVAREASTGPAGQGSIPLEDLAHRLGLEVEVVPSVLVDGAAVSSAAVRGALLAGDLAHVERSLGREYSIGGRVVHGHHRGKAIGIPTANVMPRGVELPPDGVYAVWASLTGRKLAGVANIGRKPTFGDLERSVEVHILDFAEEIYGRRLDVAFARRLRGEVRFPGVAALVAQIRADIERARVVLARS